MDDKITPTSDTNNKDLPPTGDAPEVSQSNSDTASQSDLKNSGVKIPPPFPSPGDTPPLPPPLSPDEVKTPTQPLPSPISEDKSKDGDLDLPIKPIDSPVLTENEDEEIVKPKKPIDSEGLEPGIDTSSNVSQSNNETATQKNSDAAASENSDTPIQQGGDTASQDTQEVSQSNSDTATQPITPPSPELAESDTTNEPVAPPKKDEMPVEAKFPGQPLPSEAQKDLEEKAKEMIDKDGGVKERKVSVAGKPKGNVAKTLVGVLLMVLVGGGVFVGTNLAGKTTENRSLAGGTGGSSCPTKAQCGGFTSCSGGLKYCTDSGTEQCNWVCDTHSRINCCDGAWLIGPRGGDSDALCSGHGGHSQCGTEESNDDNDSEDDDRCTCESWGSNSCGKNCRFPSGTNGQSMADSTCSPVIAMCNVSSGKVTYENLEESGCKDQVNVCKNPVYYPNCQPDPKQCNESCNKDSDCGSGTVCDPTSNTCRNNTCLDSVNCTCPDGDLVCNSLTSSTTDMKMGESYSFTCNASVTGVKSIAKYQFRYQRNADGWKPLELSAADSNVSVPLQISGPGGHVIQCRVCEDTTNDLCTPYQVVDPN